MLTCTGVSFAHGSNDGQKGMGLIMLILIGTVPTAYALNHAVTAPADRRTSWPSRTQTADVLDTTCTPNAVVGDPRDEVTDYVRTKHFTPNTMLALRELINDIGNEMALYKELKAVPQDKVRNFRNDMYVVSEALRLMQKTGKPQFTAADAAMLTNYKKHIDNATKFIPSWVKVAVALGAGHGHDGRLEAHRGDRGRENRQGPPDLWAGRRGGNHRDGHHRRGGLVRIAREYDARAFVGRRGYHGRQPLGAADGARCAICRWLGCLRCPHPLFCRLRCSGLSAPSAANRPDRTFPPYRQSGTSGFFVINS